ncbi:LysR family transcriptional regulator [Oceanospirillum maris]|uniref:LysR family transcriptional regulator n=1 Tax=Oceanospirillum maris TaxID=64977 RepID=UPI0003FE130D|nr:LysR family transcriptional regulator [Oceanospirillum maris]
MALNNLDLDALEIFRAVAVEGGVTKAALQLNRVQSNISTRIMQLEERLNVTLFNRVNRRLELTTEGQLLLVYADQLLQLAEDTEAAFKGGVVQGLFRLGSMESTAAARLPELLSLYHAQHPKVQLDLITDTTSNLVEQIQNYEIEAAFVGAPITSDEFESMEAHQEKLLLITARGKGFTCPKDALNENLITFRSGCAYRRVFENWLASEGARTRNCMEMSSYHALAACVAAGTGIAIIPESVLDVLLIGPSIQRFELPKEFATVKTLLIWRKGYQSSKLDGIKTLVTSLAIRHQAEIA